MRFLISVFLILSIFSLPANAQDKASGDWKMFFSKKAKEYESFFEKMDATSIANLWSKDGIFTLSDGTKLEGREEIEKYYKQYFRDAGPELITVKVTSVKELVPGKAIIEVGTTKPDQGDIPTAQYRVLHINNDGNWQVAWAEETMLPRAYSLNDLKWLKGRWSSKSDSSKKVSITVSSIAKGSFLKLKNKSYGHTVIIGLNPVSGTLHSWHFDSNGGIGEGDWEKRKGAWNLATIGVTKDGMESRAIYSLKPIGKDKFLWRSTERFIEGSSIPDLEEVEMIREKGGN